MRKLFLFILVITAFGMQAQEIKWITMNEALAAQKKNPKKIVVDVYADWCGPCKMMDRNTFTDKNVINYINENFYAVKFNAEGTEEVTYNGKTFTNPKYQANKRGRNATHQFPLALQVRAYPSLVYFDEEGAVIQTIPGYFTPSQLEIYLKMMATDDYKEITTAEAWNAYQKAFEGTF